MGAESLGFYLAEAFTAATVLIDGAYYCIKRLRLPLPLDTGFQNTIKYSSGTPVHTNSQCFHVPSDTKLWVSVFIVSKTTLTAVLSEAVRLMHKLISLDSRGSR